MRNFYAKALLFWNIFIREQGFELNIKAKNTIKEVSMACVLFGFHTYELKVLLLQWNENDCSLPMGRIHRMEPLADAASRVLMETTGIEDIFLQQFYTVSTNQNGKPTIQNSIAGLNVDKAKGQKFLNKLFQETMITIGYYGLIDFEKVVPNENGLYHWHKISSIPDLLFDNHDLIELALVALRKDLRYLPIAKLLPQKFTLREMQILYETILNRQFDRRNFHKLLMKYDFLIKLPEKKTGTANKSPHLYQIDFEKYEAALQDGISY
ncbi:MAG: NUDIX hydrolase [Saprospiraceae bacterium]